jgi:hypothetical protein
MLEQKLVEDICDVCQQPGHTLEACAYTPYIRSLQKLMMSFCLPVWFRNESGDRAKGSMTVVDSGEMLLGVTAGHVADRILECCDDRPGGLCQVGSVDLPRDSFIVRHSDLDLATFELSSSRLDTIRSCCAQSISMATGYAKPG